MRSSFHGSCLRLALKSFTFRGFFFYFPLIICCCWGLNCCHMSSCMSLHSFSRMKHILPASTLAQYLLEMVNISWNGKIHGYYHNGGSTTGPSRGVGELGLGGAKHGPVLPVNTVDVLHRQEMLLLHNPLLKSIDSLESNHPSVWWKMRINPWKFFFSGRVRVRGTSRYRNVAHIW